MNLSSPWMLLGLVAAALPIAIHLQGRRKAPIVHFAALDYLLATDKRLAKRLVVRQWALLLVRCALFALLSLVLARPYSHCSEKGIAVESGPQSAVFIVDNALASQAKWKGQSLLERSRAEAQSFLRRLGPEARVSILDTTGQLLAELSRDHVELRGLLKDLQGNAKAPKFQLALDRANEVLAESNDSQKTIFVFAGQRASLFSENEYKSAYPVQLVDPSAGQELPNLSLESLRVEPAPGIGNRGIRVVASVRNFGKTQQESTLEMSVDGEAIAVAQIVVQAESRLEKSFSASLPNKSQLAEVHLRLGRDALNLDNHIYALADSGQQVRALLINGDPRSVRFEDELFYFETALRPGDRESGNTKITSIQSDALEDQNLDNFDAIVLANLESLSSSQVDSLHLWVQEGGGLLVAMGDKSDPQSYNQSLEPLLVQPLRSILNFEKGLVSESDGLRLTQVEHEHPIFSVFRSEDTGLAKAKFSQIMLTRPSSKASSARVLARFSNDAPALLESEEGSGKLLLYTSTLDRAWNDLPIHPGYLPLIQQTIRHLASKPNRSAERNVRVGEAHSLSISDNIVQLEIRGPTGNPIVLEGSRVSGRKRVLLDPFSQPGVYRIEARAEGEEALLQAPMALAVNIVPEAANLVPAAPSFGAVSKEHAAGKRKDNKRKVEWWHLLSGTLVLLAFGESLISAYGARREAAPN